MSDGVDPRLGVGAGLELLLERLVADVELGLVGEVVQAVVATARLIRAMTKGKRNMVSAGREMVWPVLHLSWRKLVLKPISTPAEWRVLPWRTLLARLWAGDLGV